MKYARKLITVGLLGLCAGVWADAGHEHTMRPGSQAFEQLKQLVGTWQGTKTPEPGSNEKPQPIAVQMELTAAGSAIEETLMPGTPHEMIDMYADENGKLAMTHYCAMGNHPHMVLKEDRPGLISLEMGTTPDINAAKDAHMHALVLEFPDANHLTEKWTSYNAGKAGSAVVFTLTRTKKS